MDEKNVNSVRRYFEDLWNKGDLTAIPDVLKPDAVAHYVRSVSPVPIRIFDVIEDRVKAERHAFPDVMFKIEDIVACNDKVAVRWTMTGTQQHEFMGITASSKSVVVQGMGIFRLSEGKISELWIVSDDFGMMQQLGTRITPKSEPVSATNAKSI